LAVAFASFLRVSRSDLSASAVVATFANTVQFVEKVCWSGFWAFGWYVRWHVFFSGSDDWSPGWDVRNSGWFEWVTAFG